MMKSKTVTIILYVFAAIFACYAIFAIVSTSMYIASVSASGLYGNIGFSDILSVYFGQVGPYLFDALALFGLGYLITPTLGKKEAIAKDYTSNRPDSDVSNTLLVDQVTDALNQARADDTDAAVIAEEEITDADVK